MLEHKRTVSKSLPVMRILLIAWLIVVGLFLAACGPDCPEPHSVTTAQLNNTPQLPSVTTANQLVVYVDTSASMAGYVVNDREKQTRFSRTLQELRNFVTLINPPVDVLVRRVAVRVGDPANDMLLSQASVNTNLFNGADTDLAGAVDAFEQPISSNGPPRFHVLVTDGVQSTSQERPDFACTSGSDQLCVRKKVFSLLNKGWGGCVIGLRSEFHGKIYSEINRAQRRPSVLRFDSDDSRSESFRPFYLYVFSPDRAALEPFVTTLVERIRPLVAQDESSLRILPLTSQYANGVTQAEATVAKNSSSLLTVRKKANKDFPEFIVAVDPDSAQKGAQPFSLTITLPWNRNASNGMTAQELGNMISWQIVPVYPKSLANSTRYPEVKIVGHSVDDTGRILLQASAQWLPSVGRLCWRGYRLEGRLDPQVLSPPWVREWSTNLDTTIESANKTLFLETALLGLWRNSVLNHQLVAEISLIAGER